MDQPTSNKGIKQLSILDLVELDGDEDDDEYNPAEEEEVEDEEEELGEDLLLGGPIQQLPVETSDIEMSESDMIARRTRSKFQIEEEPKDTLEFPDVTEDLYEEAMAEDDEYSVFLKALFQDDPSKFFDEDEAKDPDYEFDDVNEIIRRETGGHGVPGDLSLGFLSQHDQLPIVPVEKIDLKSVSSSDLSEWSKFFTKEDIELLYHQMSQHVQLLTQHYLLTVNSSTLGAIAENAAFLLKELNQFGQGKKVSLFQAPNLPDALKILEECPIEPNSEPVVANSWRQCPVPLNVRPIFVAYPQVFCYHELIPQTGYPDVTLSESKRKGNSRSKNKFSRPEDHLIALALDQFKEVEIKNRYQYIQQLLLPVKSVEQIKMHVKNKKRHTSEKSATKCDENNPLTYYLKYGKLLPFDRTIPTAKYFFSPFDSIPVWLCKQLDPQFTPSPKMKILHLHKPAHPKYPTSALSPKKQTSVILKKYRYLSKLPSIKPKANLIKTSETTVINSENSPSVASLLPLTKGQPSPVNQSSSSSPKQQLTSHQSPQSTQPSPQDSPSAQSSESTPISSITIPESPLIGSVEDQCNLEPDPILTIDTEMTVKVTDPQEQSSQSMGETDEPERIEIDISESIEEVVSSEAFDEIDQSPGQQSTNLTSKSDSPTNPCSVEKETELMAPNEDDDEMDLAALMAASSTIIKRNFGRNKSHDASSGSSSKKEAKKSLTTKHRESTILLLSEEDWLLNDSNREQKEQIMVQCFVSKVREALKSDEDYVQFLTYLSEFGKNRSSSDNASIGGDSIKDLHLKAEKLLRKVNAQQVMEDFVLLLNASEAQECGKMYQYLHWRRYLSFIRKLEVYSAVEPNCIPRLHKTLVQLKASETPVNKQRLKAAVSKAISGHPYLINEFSSLFLDERPKDYLFASDEDYDNLVITSVQNVSNPPAASDVNSESEGGGGVSGLSSATSGLNDDLFENVLVDLSDEERKYGTNECPCKLCHNNSASGDSQNVSSSVNNTSESGNAPSSTNPISSSTTTATTTTTTTTNVPPLRHCAACSLRFIGGKIYLQGPKKIQPAEVQYPPNQESRPSSIVSRNISSTDSQQSRQSGQPTIPTCVPTVNKSPVSINQPSSIVATESTIEIVTDEKAWSFAEDKMLLESFKARVSSDDETNLSQLFAEISSVINRPIENVIERFNQLMELLKHESSSASGEN